MDTVEKDNKNNNKWSSSSPCVLYHGTEPTVPYHTTMLACSLGPGPGPQMRHWYNLFLILSLSLPWYVGGTERERERDSTVLGQVA